MSLQLRKLDLHVHTPASHDFEDKAASLEGIVKQALQAGLAAIAITDHNSVASVDAIKDIASKTPLAIFPGFELSCHGAKSGSIHVIGLFDPRSTQKDLERVLGRLEVRKEGEESLSAKSVDEVVNIIRDAGGLPSLAHANSSNGALSDIRGNPRKELVKNPKLIAVEATKGDFSKEQGTRLIDLLDGNDPQYKRQLAVYQSSDNPGTNGTGHCTASVGSNYTYFHMGELTLESLRQCFADPVTRIVQPSETERVQIQSPGIKSIKVKGGFLDGLTVLFHSGMNSVIGGTGTGKSLLIEFLRFVFGKPSHERLAKETKDKLEKQLGRGGAVTVHFADASGEEYELTRTYNGPKENQSPSTCRNISTGKVFSGDVASIFPILFYSQNEILEVTRDSRAQLRLLDTFRDFSSYRNDQRALTSELRTLDSQLVGALNAAKALPGLKTQLGTVSAQLISCEKKLRGKASPKANTYLAFEKQKGAAESKLKGFVSLLAQIDKASDDITSKLSKLPPKQSAPANPSSDVIEVLRQAHKDTLVGLDKTRKNIAVQQAKAIRVIRSWERVNKLATLKRQYDKDIKKKGLMKKVEEERQALVLTKEEVVTKFDEAQAAASLIKKLRLDRQELLSRLNGVRTAYFKERETQAKAITERSGGKLSVKVTFGTDTEKYKRDLLTLKVGTYAEGTEIDRIVNTIPVVTFVEAVLDEDSASISEAANLTDGKAEALVALLNKPECISQALALQHASYPTDSIEILYRKQDGNHYPLTELSMGQKADALVMIALGDSQMPVIIDQPEDALDISSIWEDICQRLRTSKHVRQFVFTTHNSSIAVASDSDEYIVMNADAEHGWVEVCGSIEHEDVKRKVIDHLEGGKASYELKRRKYDL